MGVAAGVLPVILAVLFVGLLIVIHEAGHYFAARWGGMRVNSFSVGFGPVLYKKRWGETEFLVSAIPLGGYVDIAGLREDDGTPADDPRSYQNRSFIEKFTAVLAGPVFNYAAAILLLWAYFAAFNIQFTGPFRVLTVLPDTPAEAGGLKKDDVIVGSPDAALNNRGDVDKAIQASQGGPLRFDVRRGEETLTVEVRPRKEGSRYFVGINYRETAGVERPLGLVSGLQAAAQSVWRQSAGMLQVLSRLVSAPSEVSGRVSGPIGIVQQLAQAIESAPVAALTTVAGISVALGLFNLLPIPALDGSRLLFLLIGAIRRRPVPARFENTVHGVGFLLLFSLLLVVSWNDVMRWLAG